MQDDDLRNLLRVTKAINAHLNVDEQLPLIMDAVMDLTRAERGFLVLYDEAGGALQTRERRGDDSGAGFSRRVVQRVLQSGESLWVLDTDVEPSLADAASIQKMAIRTVMCTPLSSRRGVIGAIYVDSTTTTRAFGARQREIFGALAGHAAIALENARLYQMSVTDPMTGLYNHAYLLRRLETAFRDAMLSESALTLMMVDIDHFKAINDTRGHRFGNAILRGVARVLRRVASRGDTVARYGGDEFALVVPHREGEPIRRESGEAPDYVLSMAEHIRAEAAALDLGEEEPPTLSIGLASFPHHAPLDVPDLLELADRALYAAKAAGRDRVMVAEPPSRGV